jgi:hypothetical protein
MLQTLVQFLARCRDIKTCLAGVSVFELYSCRSQVSDGMLLRVWQSLLSMIDNIEHMNTDDESQALDMYMLREKLRLQVW